MKVDEHFNQAVDMVKIGNGSFRKVSIFRLSRMACMIIAENADNRKVLVQQARDYFGQSVSMIELLNNSLSSNILLYKTAQGEARIEVISIAKHSGCRRKEWQICTMLMSVR